MLKTLISELSKHTSRSYYVGGYVRDSLLGLDSKDIDIEVYDIKPEVLNEILTKLDFKLVGKEFHVYRFENIDVSLPRTENKTGFKHTDFEISITNDTYEASLRRDLTINSIMKNIFTNEILDHHNGISDLNNKIIRCVNEEKFSEDNLRKLRAIRFALKFNFDIENNTFNFLKSLNLEYISKDRIWNELDKIFKLKNPKTFKLLYDLDIFKDVFNIDIDFYKIQNLLSKDVKKDYRLIMYLISKFYKIDILYNEYKFKDNYDFSLYSLINMSFKMPLNEFIGCFNDESIKIAKKLNIYFNRLENPKFDGSESVSEIKKLKDIKILDKIKEFKLIN